jgi:glycerol-3-phosphate acyltransferase PlsY
MLPAAYAGLYRGEAFSWLLMGFCTAAGVLVIAMHRKNIGRLLAGTEARLGKPAEIPTDRPGEAPGQK